MSIYNIVSCGHSSVVERLVANEKVEGSTPLPAPIYYERFNNKKMYSL